LILTYFYQNIFKALHWILSPEAPKQQPPVLLLEDLLSSEDFLHVDEQEKWLRQQLKVTGDIIETTVEKTKGQRSNALWAAVRKLRITASNFGQVLRAVRLKRYFKNYCHECEFKSICCFYIHNIQCITQPFIF
jgi:hypothetical protein